MTSVQAPLNHTATATPTATATATATPTATTAPNGTKAKKSNKEDHQVSSLVSQMPTDSVAFLSPPPPEQPSTRGGRDEKPKSFMMPLGHKGSECSPLLSPRQPIRPPIAEISHFVSSSPPRTMSMDSIISLYDPEDQKEPNRPSLIKTNYSSTNHTNPIKKSTSTSPSSWKLDVAALHFATRMAILLTLSSLFVLVKSPWTAQYYKDGMWVLVSVLFVSWFPSMDAASVIEKITQRLLGTFIGAFLGLTTGIISIIIFPTRSFQATFLIICLFIHVLGIIFVAGQFTVKKKKIIRRYSYATILCTLTLCICMLPFGLEQFPKWESGLWRVGNVVVGCAMGALGSLLILPKSTVDVLHEKTAKQVRLAGEASEAVLKLAADLVAGRLKAKLLSDELLHSHIESTDVALEKYAGAIADWGTSKSMFTLLRLDPLRVLQHEAHTGKSNEIAVTLARSLRLQTTLVVLDGMIRSNAEFDFGDAECHLLGETGSLVRDMLSLPTGFSDEKPIETTKNLSAALSLFDKLQTVRELIIDLSNTVGSPDSSIQELRDRELALFKRSLILGQDENEGSRGIPKLLSERHNNTLFFLQLVDHIILRSIRLFQSWRDVLAMEEKKRQMEKATSSKVSSLRGRVAAGSTFVSNEDDTASVGTDEIDQISVNSTLFATRLSHSDLSAWQK